MTKKQFTVGELIEELKKADPRELVYFDEGQTIWRVFGIHVSSVCLEKQSTVLHTRGDRETPSWIKASVCIKNPEDRFD